MRHAPAVLSLLLAGLVLSGPALAGSRYLIHVDGLTCPFCAYGIEKSLYRSEGVEAIETHIAEGAVVVEMRDGAELNGETAEQAVTKAGFSMRGFERLADDASR